jgi:hypothetical protein
VVSTEAGRQKERTSNTMPPIVNVRHFDAKGFALLGSTTDPLLTPAELAHIIRYRLYSAPVV